MGKACYDRWLQEMGQTVAMGPENEGNMVEALLAFNWVQERAAGQLEEMGDMVEFHQKLQEELEKPKSATKNPTRDRRPQQQRTL